MIRSRIGFVLGLSLGLVMAASLAFAQEGGEVSEPDTGPPAFDEAFPPGNPEERPALGTEEGDLGPPFLTDSEWRPGPPSWAGLDDSDGEGPPSLIDSEWRPGPPSWAGLDDPDNPAPWINSDWKPGVSPGPPPWAEEHIEEGVVPAG